jgi:hypothetical protein
MLAISKGEEAPNFSVANDCLVDELCAFVSALGEAL